MAQLVTIPPVEELDDEELLEDDELVVDDDDPVLEDDELVDEDEALVVDGEGEVDDELAPDDDELLLDDDELVVDDELVLSAEDGDDTAALLVGRTAEGDALDPTVQPDVLREDSSTFATTCSTASLGLTKRNLPHPTTHSSPGHRPSPRSPPSRGRLARSTRGMRMATAGTRSSTAQTSRVAGSPRQTPLPSPSRDPQRRQDYPPCPRSRPRHSRGGKGGRRNRREPGDEARMLARHAVESTCGVIDATRGSIHKKKRSLSSSSRPLEPNRTG